MTFVHYEVQEHAVGDSILVEALLYDAVDLSGNGPPPPLLSVTADGIPYTRMPACWSRNSPYEKYVYMPNALMRLFGDTLDKRLARARATVERRAKRTVTHETRLWQAWHSDEQVQE